jgi:hypothetical protein
MAKLFGEYKIYPRGFLGAKLAPSVERTPNPMQNLRYDARIFDAAKEETIHGNAQIEQLFVSYTKGIESVLDFDFCEKILKAAKAAFGTDHFASWYRAQFLSPGISDMHIRFLDDTLQFIRTGRRSVHINTWDAMVDIAEGGQSKTPLSAEALSFFGGDLLKNDTIYRDELNQVLHDWVTCTNGYDDLMATLHILFAPKL